MFSQKMVNKKRFWNQLADGGILMNAYWQNNKLVSFGRLTRVSPEGDVEKENAKKNIYSLYRIKTITSRISI